MSQMDEAWSDVGERFKRLGSMYKEHYKAHAVDAEAESATDEEVAEALRQLGASIRTAFEAAGDTISDPELKEEARGTASSFFNALGTTFNDLAAQIATKRERTQEPPTATEPEAGESVAEEAEPLEDTTDQDL
jgi:Flp pilus assembly pilin Flp